MTRTRAEIAPDLATHIGNIWAMVDETKQTLAEYERQLKVAVSKARSDGASWRAIGEALGTSEAKQMLEYAIEVGRGGMYLRLTPGQYAASRRSRGEAENGSDPSSTSADS